MSFFFLILKKKVHLGGQKEQLAFDWFCKVHSADSSQSEWYLDWYKIYCEYIYINI